MAEAESQIKHLRIKRGSFKSQLTSFEKFLKTVTKENLTTELGRNLTNRLQKIESLFDLFNEVQNEIEYLVYDNVETHTKEVSEREIFNDSYYKAISAAQEILSLNNQTGSIQGDQTEQFDVRSTHTESVRANSISSASETRNKCKIKLPTINLPIFDGSFTAWRSFFDAYKTLIHQNHELTNVQKLTYLKSALKGEPHDLIVTLESTDANYSIAIGLLERRYDNKRRIINNHVQSILHLPTISRESSTQFKELTNSLQTQINCLRSLDQPVDSWDAILVPIIISKLDNQTMKEWETKLTTDSIKNDEIPRLTDLIEFLTNKLLTLEIIGQKRSEHLRGTSLKQSPRSFATTVSHVCPNCGKDHLIYNCDSFLKLDENAKNKVARKLKMCINCLRKGHFLSDCRSKSTCKVCNKKHHTLLHYKDQVTQNKSKDETVSCSSEESATLSLININSQTLLSTAVVHVSKNNKYHNVRLLLDSASQSNFVTEELCNLLKLKRNPIKMNVIGINQESLKITNSVDLTFKSRVTNYSVTIKCLVVPQIASAIPSHSYNSGTIQIPVNIKLADPNYNESAPIDILIGANIFWSLISVGQIKQDQVILQKTKLGWILAGELINEKNCETSVSCLSFEKLNKNVERFWYVDQFESKTKILTKDEEFCETNFSETTTRNSDGKFVVRIPFKQGLDQIGDSYSTAKRRFTLLEDRLEKDAILKANYCEFMNEYITLHHMQRIETTSHDNAFYLPHHCVIKESSETTKLRVVFDGSCKDSNGVSINDLQYAGPTLQDDIFAIIARFRTYQYVVTADIAKMYRQIWVHPDHRRYQRILWRKCKNEPISVYELNTVTYGTTSAPYLAIRCLTEIANEIENQYPCESRVIREDFYVDDLITGCNDLNELIQIKQKIINRLECAGFHLRKFHSNVPELLDLEANNSDLLNMSDKNHKALGVCWNPSRDTFSYSINIKVKPGITKRTILAVTAQLYDPLGLLAPIVVIAKLIVQELWHLKLSWDETVPMETYSQWTKFKNNIHHINNITTSRKVIIDKYVSVEMHAFSDASERAYGACIYLKSFNGQGQSLVTLLAAKSRLAPLKQVTLPRLELCAAVLAAQLVDKFKTILRTNFSREHYWCDSQITLCWIKAEPKKWKSYVANRVAEIQRLTISENWAYVKSQDNPADLISRGVPPELLKDRMMWWQGPEWLVSDSYIHADDISKNLDWSNLPEKRSAIQSFTITNTVNDFPIQRFSDLTRLKRVTAYCIRFINNARATSSNYHTSGPLTVSELEMAMTKLIQITQRTVFAYEINKLSKGQCLERKNKLMALTPFIDSGVLRVGGRLKHSQFSYDKKHPIILPKRNHFTELVVQHEHVKHMHAAPRLLLHSTRETFWPIDGMNVAKKIVRNCVICAKFNTKPVMPIMGQLPYERTLAMYPFHTTGIDYAGPYSIKDGIGKRTKITKSYICLFICFATKAIHLEVVTNLSTNSFLMSFKRFIARRGKPLNVFSDNGTNFVGAHNELSNLGEFLRSNADTIEGLSANEGIKWQFIPPRSPTFGGLWEAGVKSVKFHLKRVMLNTVFTYEEFQTILTQVEAILNSRPLTPLTSDPNDLEPLTPAHFLIGRPYTTLPDPNVQELPQNRLNRYQLLQQFYVQFWKRWSRDYISQLQQKSRCRQNTANINLGSMVIIKDDNLPPALWRLGRVIQLHPGIDGVTRVVTVRCVKGDLKRAVNRVCILPVEI